MGFVSGLMLAVGTAGLARRHTLAVVTICLCVVAAPAPAEAAVSVRYVRSGEVQACPAGDRFAEVVSSAADQATLGEPARVVTVELTRDGVGYAATVRFARADGAPLGQRVLRSADCDDLVAAVGFAVAMGIEATAAMPSSRAAPPASPAAPPASPAAPPASPAAPPAAPAAPPAAHAAPPAAHAVASAADAPSTDPRAATLDAAGSWPAVQLFAVAVGRAGTAPSPVAGIVVGSRLRVGRLAFALGLGADLPSEGPAGPGSVVASRAGVDVAACALARPFDLCAVASVGVGRFTGRDLYAARTVSTPFADLGVRAALSLGRGVFCAVELGTPLVPIEVRDSETSARYWRSSSLSAAVTLGVRLPGGS